MKIVVRIEEAAMAALALYGLSFYTLGLPAWAWVLIFFSPDLSMIGYLINNRFGAFLYNLCHHKALAICVAAIGYWLQAEWLIASDILLFAHSSFDRMLGYGLKYSTGFKDTHLGSLEREK